MTVSRKIRNLLRRERRADPSVQSLLARLRAETPERRLVRTKAQILHRRFGPRGAEWAACVQAVKSGGIEGLLAKYGR